MEKSKYADIAIVLALLSLVSPILAILTSTKILPNVAIFGSLAVSGTGLLGLILGIMGYKDTEQKWKSIAAVVIYIVGTIIYFALSFRVIFEFIMDMVPVYTP